MCSHHPTPAILSFVYGKMGMADSEIESLACFSFNIIEPTSISMAFQYLYKVNLIFDISSKVFMLPQFDNVTFIRDIPKPL